MASASSSSRWALAVVRYWGGALSLTRSEDGSQWPGFYYEEDEIKQLDALAEQVGPGEFGRFLLLNSLVFIALAALVLVALFLPTLKAMYPDLSQMQAGPFFGLLGLVVALAVGLGLPLSMVLSGVVLSRYYMHPELPELSEDRLRHLFRKMVWQCLRAVLLGGGLALGIAGYLAYSEARIDMLWHIVLRFVAPAISASCLLYFFSRRIAKGG